jgi:hypothetical protein
MKLKEINGGYQLWLSANDTYNWAHKAGASWPCSTLSDHRLFVLVDNNGLCDYTVDGKECPDLSGDELTACVSDHLPESLHAFWPVWKYSKTA